MNTDPQLIVMLTYNDLTVGNAEEIFNSCRNSPAQYWGMKEEPLSPNKMKALYNAMKECGKKTVLEVVAYTENKCLEGARLAAECGCDILMGTVFFDSVNDFCKENNLKYMPFVGDVSGRPSVLGGTIDGMISEANEYIRKGAFGIDLLGYRFVNDASELIRRFVNEVNAPVCVAGSVDSYDRLDELKQCAPWAFTVGSAFFDNCFADDFNTAVNRVCQYIGR